jgi:ribonuclease E
MADDLQAGEDTTTSPAAEKPVKKAAAKKTAAKKAPAKAAAKKAPAKKAAAKKTAPAADPVAPAGDDQLDLGVDAPPAKKAAKRAPAKKAAAKKTAAKTTAAPDATPAEAPADEPAATALLFQAPAAKKTPARRTRKTAAAAPAEADEAPTADAESPVAESPVAESPDGAEQVEKTPKKKSSGGKQGGRSGGRKSAKADELADEDESAESTESAEPTESTDEDESAEGDEQSGDGNGPARRRRRRGGRRRRKPGDANADGDSDESEDSDDTADDAGAESATDSEDGSGDSPSSRRRRRRRRSGDDGGGEGGDDPANTVTRVRRQRSAEDEITSIQGSTRLEAKKQRRREGREAGRRRAPIVSEAEFLARREAVDRVMVVRQREDLTQIGVLEDKVLVEHYVARASQTSLIGNVYLGRVQNVLPSMEAAFIDIGKGRNAVLYAGEVNWSALGHKDGQPRKIESVLSSGQTILVQVSKDPIGHKGARLTSQISLAGRFLVYVPDGTTSGISRKLPDTERNRLKTLLKEIVPDTAGVIVRTAAEGASEDELTRDVERLKARWEDIERKVKGSAPQLLYGEPDLTLKVVRDLFTEDFTKLVIQGDDAWDTVQGYVAQVAPDLEQRLERYEPGANGQGGKADVFSEYRIEEQIAKGLDRKVWLPSGGSLVIDRTEAMTVVDVNTGKFTGSGGNLEETVTKNNLEAAEEIVRQLRLRDIGGIIVVDFIDMVLESNRDLVLRRLIECLGRDRTRHQVAEVTSLGLVQMTRKRIGTGLVEAFSENCSHCQGRGLVIHDAPVAPKESSEDEPRRGGGGGGGGRRGRGRGRGQDDNADSGNNGGGQKAPSPKDVAAMARPENEPVVELDETPVPAQDFAAVVEETQVVESTPDVEPAEAPAPEPDTEPAAPKVTTRSRRRSSTPRPAAEPAPVVVAEPAPVVEEPAFEAPPAPPEPPKVITRTRGRSATRPAGPPAEVSTADLAEEPVATTGDEDGDHPEGEHPHVEHVPIKKKGSRKR